MTIILKRRESARITLVPAIEAKPATKESAAVEGRAGVVLVVRPAGQADFDLASAAAGRHIAAIAEGKESLDRYGLQQPEGEGYSPETMKAMFRVGEAILAIELGIRHITSWEGVMMDDDTVAPLEPATIALLFNARPDGGSYSYGHTFLEKMQGISTLETPSKNVSSVSPAG